MTSILVGHGFPFDVAESWSEEERTVQLVIIGEMRGQSFDWVRMRWEKPNKD